MKKLRILDGQWRVQSNFDVYADGYYVGTTRNTGGNGNNYDINHATLFADAGNTYHATQMLPSEMAERIKALEDGLRNIIRDAGDDKPEDPGPTGNEDDARRYGYERALWHSAQYARTLLTPPIDEAHGHLLSNPE